MRLIDADALRVRLDTEVPCFPLYQTYNKEDVIRAVMDAPTVAEDTNVPGKWISVKDRLPDDLDAVLIVKQLKSGIRQIGLGYCIKEHPRHDYQTGEDVVEPYWVCGGNNNVIYWQELPKIPERGDGE